MRAVIASVNQNCSRAGQPPQCAGFRGQAITASWLRLHGTVSTLSKPNAARCFSYHARLRAETFDHSPLLYRLSTMVPSGINTRLSSCNALSGEGSVSSRPKQITTSNSPSPQGNPCRRSATWNATRLSKPRCFASSLAVVTILCDQSTPTTWPRKLGMEASVNGKSPTAVPTSSTLSSPRRSNLSMSRCHVPDSLCAPKTFGPT